MDTVPYRIVDLPAMRVAALRAFGPSPEEEAWNRMLAWAKERGLLDGQPAPRFFGFNNPNPTPGSPNYGYEVWITVGPQVQPEQGVEILEIPAQRCATLLHDGHTDEIFPAWQRLVAAVEQSPHAVGDDRCLEEHLRFFDPESGTIRLDLLLPVSA